MLRLKSLFASIPLFFLLSSFSDADLTAQQIMKKAELKLAATSVVATSNVTVVRPKWTKTMTLKTWTKGSSYAMAYVISPDKDKGTVYLKNMKNVYSYLPKVKKTVKIPSSLLGQNWMGTDLSTDDLVKLTQLTKDYNATLVADETVSGRLCYTLELLPKSTADVIWGKLKVSIDKKDFIQLRTTFYDEDLEAISVLTGSNIKVLGGRRLASRYTMTPTNRSGHSSVIEYKSMLFNTAIATSFFAKENMPKVKP